MPASVIWAKIDVMGIQSWVLRENSATSLYDCRDDQAAKLLGKVDGASEMNWEMLQGVVQKCERCALHASRNQTVFGSGNRSASWMLIGEAPGKEEDLQGRPFVGRAGRLLTEMLLAVGLSRETVFIANILKCRPPENRDPAPEEVESCKSYLERQIELVQPEIILAVGRVAAQNLLATSQPLSELRGKIHHYGGTKIPVVVVYHPAYLLRSIMLPHWQI